MSTPAAAGNSLRKRRRRGLWKARANTAMASRFPARDNHDRQETPSNSNFGSDIEDNRASSSSTASREQHHLQQQQIQQQQQQLQLQQPQPKSTTPTTQFIDTNTDDDEVYYYVDYSRKSSPYSASIERVSNWTARTKVIDTSTTAGSSMMTTVEAPRFSLDDWEDLKDLFNKASELYEDYPSEALPTLRGMLHECHRLMHSYEDPSVLFSQNPRFSPSQLDDNDDDTHNSPFSTGARKWKGSELPTAFHSILGAALYLMGNIIDQDPSLAFKGEPNNAVFYWLYALDVFEAGENLPSRTSGRGYEAPEDWNMSIFWGRTYVCLAEETVDRMAKAKQLGEEYVSPIAQFAIDPEWPKESPFHIIAARRPTTTRRMSLENATANELMVLAVDQFSRGIFHMPHPKPPVGGPKSKENLASEPGHQEIFSRAGELFNIAYDVLLVADKLETPTERQDWASWANSVFEQIKDEGDMDPWRGPVNRARGRCWLIFGSAGAVMLDAQLERGELDVLHSEEAEDARDALLRAIEFFERATTGSGSGSGTAMSDQEASEVQKMLVESLVTLANLTFDGVKREELYARANALGVPDLELAMDCDSDDDEVMRE